MKRALMMLTIALLLLLGCTEGTKGDRSYCLQGAWILQRMQYPTGTERHYTIEGSGTYCLIYDSDSMLYECMMATTPSGLVFMPTAKYMVTLIDRGNGDLLYLENGDPHPLTIVNDTIITIQRNGILYSWLRADSIAREWGPDIRDIVAMETDNGNPDESHRYVLSVKERQQERTIQWFVFFSAFIVLVSLIAAHWAIVNRRDKRQLQLQLQQIREVQENRPQAVKQVVATVESTFFASDDYAALQKRIANGQVMKKEDWQQIEQYLKTVYPGFISQLRSLHPMSELELQTCQLIKLRIAPSDIAAVLARDVSTISTVRSRLYKKVFGKKGGAKDWDEFILRYTT